MHLEFENLYKDYAPGLKIYLARIAPLSDTEDLFQTVCEKINKELYNFKGLSSIKTWLYKIATNAAYDALRSLSSKKQIFNQHSVDPDAHEKNHQSFFGSKELTDLVLMKKQMSACVLDVIETLEDPYKTVMILKHLEDFTNKEIAQILQISVENVKIISHRGKNKLKKKLEHKCSFSYDERNVFVCVPKQDT